jgi:hypothetical protein
VQVIEKYQVKISNRFQALVNFGGSGSYNRSYQHHNFIQLALMH